MLAISYECRTCMSLSAEPLYPRRSHPGTILVVVVVLVAACLFAWHRYAAKPVVKAPPAAVPVHMALVGRHDLHVWLNGIGTVQALNTVTVKSRVDGELNTVAFTEGQMVTQGQLLAEIDPRPFRAALVQATANARRDQAMRVNAELDLQRYAKLAQTQVIARQQLDTQRATAESALATVASDNGAVDDAKLQLGFTRIFAPITGRVGQRLEDQGSQVHATDTTGIVTITQLEPITVAFSVPQDALPAVMDAERANTASVRASTRDDGRTLAEGKLSFIDSAVDAATGQILLKAQFDNTDRALWPGAFVAARLLLRTDRQALSVPSQAVQRDQNGAFVYAVDANGRAQPKVVKTGATDGPFTAITSGLAQGDRIIVDGQANVTVGSKVRESDTVAAAR